MQAAAVPQPEEVLVVFDLETTGLKPAEGHEIIEIGAVPIIDGVVREDCAFHSLVDPARPIPQESVDVHGITSEMVAGRPQVDVVLPEFLRYCGQHALVAQNAEFDLTFIDAACERVGLRRSGAPCHDTLILSRQVHPGSRRHSLDAICQRLGIEVGRRHRSIDDVLLTAQVFLALRDKLRERGDWSG